MGADEVLAFARKQIGKPYMFGATGPNAYDCSGLVVAAFKAGADKTLPHYTGTLITYGKAVTKAQLAPGDLVFPDPHHVQIYSGGGKIIEAPRTGLNVREVNMWGFWKARRIIAPGTGNTGNVKPENPTTTPVSDPLVPDSIEHAGAFLSDPAVWRKASLYAGGAVLILIGGYVLYEGELAGAAGKVLTSVTKGN